MEALTPTPSDLQQLSQTVPAGPVVMVNLVKFRPDGGREAYSKYIELIMPLGERVGGGQVIYIGEGGPIVAGGGDWDMILLVRFESIDRFVALVGDPVYQGEARALRAQALERTHWFATTPSEAP